jgi:hypothetical protein
MKGVPCVVSVADHAGWAHFICVAASGLVPVSGEEPYRGDRRRTHAGDRRRRVAQSLDARTALLGRPAARLEVQLHDEQWLWHEAERQLVERRERAQEQSGRDDQDE